MNVKQVLKLSIVAAALAVAAGSTAAAAEAQAVTRAEVKASVLDARARGELVPAGEAIAPFATRTAGTQRSRQELRSEVLQARANGALVPAGQGVFADAPTVSMLARAEVRESVREASVRGELIPAGQGIAPVERVARAHAPRRASFAANLRH